MTNKDRKNGIAIHCLTFIWQNLFVNMLKERFKWLFRCTIIAVCGLLSACSPYKPNAQFYFPVHLLQKPTVYQYESVGATSFPTYYWHYQTIKKDDSTFLIGTQYNEQFESVQFIRERIVKSGSLLRSLDLHHLNSDSLTEITSTNVLYPAVFSFENPDTSKVLVSAFKWIDKTSNSEFQTTYRITRNRTYVKDTLIEIMGKKRQSQVWSVKERIEQTENGTLSLDFNKREIYSQNLGLTHVKRTLSNGIQEAFQLIDTFGMKELETRHQQSIR